MSLGGFGEAGEGVEGREHVGTHSPFLPVIPRGFCNQQIDTEESRLFHVLGKSAGGFAAAGGRLAHCGGALVRW